MVQGSGPCCIRPLTSYADTERHGNAGPGGGGFARQHTDRVAASLAVRWPGVRFRQAPECGLDMQDSSPQAELAWVVLSGGQHWSRAAWWLAGACRHGLQARC